MFENKHHSLGSREKLEENLIRVWSLGFTFKEKTLVLVRVKLFFTSSSLLFILKPRAIDDCRKEDSAF